MFCVSLPISHNVSENLPDPPGHFFLRLFAKASSRDVCTYFTRLIFGLLIIAFIYDLIDVFTGHFKVYFLETNYGKSEPIILLMSFCHSQMSLLMALYTVFFLINKQKELSLCTKNLTLLSGNLDATFIRLQPRLTRLRRCFWVVVVLGLVAIITTLSDPDFQQTFFDSRPYGYFITPGGVLSLYFRRSVFFKVLLEHNVQLGDYKKAWCRSSRMDTLFMWKREHRFPYILYC